MRTLSVDYGSVRIGIAMSDPTGLFAQSLTVIQRKSDAAAAEEIRSLVQEHEVERIVVGYPRNMNGSIGERAVMSEQFANRLQAVTGLPTVLYDERLTTVAAQRMLIGADVSRKKRKQVIDAVAATLLLQNYLDSVRMKADREAVETTDEGSAPGNNCSDASGPSRNG